MKTYNYDYTARSFIELLGKYRSNVMRMRIAYKNENICNYHIGFDRSQQLEDILEDILTQVHNINKSYLDRYEQTYKDRRNYWV